MIDNIDYEKIKNFTGVKIKDACVVLAGMVNTALANHDSKLAYKAIALSEEIVKRKPTTALKTHLYHTIANAWSCISKNNENPWNWDCEAFGKEIFYLRKTLLEPAFKKYPPRFRVIIYTNLANLLSTLGRTNDAIEYWDKAIETIPNFGMALGGKGIGLMDFAETLIYDNSRAEMFLYSEDLLQRALSSNTVEEHARAAFQKRLNSITQFLDKMKVKRSLLKKREPIKFYSEGFWERFWNRYIKAKPKKKSALELRESDYRFWCWYHKLVLNNLNLIEYYRENADYIHMPSMVTYGAAGMPKYYPYFNQLKQEYISARYLCYEGQKDEYTSHFSDKDVYIIDTYRGERNDLHIEKIKLAFKTAYSILDKISFFINEFYDLKQNKNFNFRNVWYKDLKERNGLLDAFRSRENWPLRGLFWLSKDIAYENNDSYSIEPEAEGIKNIRDHLEHKFLRVMMFPFNEETPAISERELLGKTLKLLKLTNSALTYLSLAIGIEESQKPEQPSDGGIIMPIYMEPKKR
jgi:tetratricopeptide (TPR) repeat protein